MCKAKQIHKGGWALESCSNNDSKPPLPDSVGTKRDASGWVWGFFTLLQLGRMARQGETRGCGGNDEMSDRNEIGRILETLSALDVNPDRWRGEGQVVVLHSTATLGNGFRYNWVTGSVTTGRVWPSPSRIPATIPSLLLPPNNKGTLKPEAFASSCLRPPS